MKKLWKIVPALAPVLTVGGVAVGTAASLNGYTVPAYGLEDFQIAREADAPAQPKNAKLSKTAQPAESSTPKLEAEPTETVQAKGAFDLKDGVYEGSGTGYRGEIKVSVKIQDQSAKAIDILSHSDDEAFFSRAKEGIIGSIISRQSVDVDVVTGATYSSNGIIEAVKNALGEKTNSPTAAPAATPINPPTSSPASTPGAVSIGQGAFDYTDGTYEGSAEGFSGTVKVSVTVKDKTITAIDILSHSDDEAFFGRAKDGVVGSILSSQKLEVDAVSGATYSSNGILNAVKNALTGAQSATSAPQQIPNTPKPKPSAASTPAAPAGAFPYPDGSYTGIGEGFGGEIAVRITLKKKSIAGIQITSHEGEDDAFFNRAKAIVDQIIQKQSVSIDAVTGATYSSNGILEGVVHALEEAKQAASKTSGETPKPQTPAPTPVPTFPSTPVPTPIPTPSDLPQESPLPSDAEVSDNAVTTFYADGEYTMTVPCMPDAYEDFEPYNLTLTLVMENDKITEIKNIAGDGDSENTSYIRRAVSGSAKYPGVVSQIVENNSTEGIDAVSHATCSSHSIVEACQEALKKAERQQE